MIKIHINNFIFLVNTIYANKVINNFKFTYLYKKLIKKFKKQTGFNTDNFSVDSITPDDVEATFTRCS